MITRLVALVVGFEALFGVCFVAPTTSIAAPNSTAERCGTGQLRVGLRAVEGGLDHQGLAVEFINRGATCALGGYPGVDGVSPSGRHVSSARRVRAGYLGGLRHGAIPSVTLRRSRTASALLEWIEGPVRGQSCPRVHSIVVTPPGDRRAARLSTHSLGTVCDLQIHPLLAGASGGAVVAR